MTNRIRIELSVPAEVRQDGSHFVSFCPPFDVYSQGPDEEAALANLVEALQLFIESCCARGTLEQVRWTPSHTQTKWSATGATVRAVAGAAQIPDRPRQRGLR